MNKQHSNTIINNRTSTSLYENTCRATTLNLWEITPSKIWEITVNNPLTLVRKELGDNPCKNLGDNRQQSADPCEEGKGR
jgi:hypothetical protein